MCWIGHMEAAFIMVIMNNGSLSEWIFMEWRIPWTGHGLQRVRHNWVTFTSPVALDEQTKPLHCSLSRKSKSYTTWKQNKTGDPWDFPGGSLVKTLCFIAKGLGLIPGQGTRIPQAAWCSQKKCDSCWEWVPLKQGISMCLCVLENGWGTVWWGDQRRSWHLRKVWGSEGKWWHEKITLLAATICRALKCVKGFMGFPPLNFQNDLKRGGNPRESPIEEPGTKLVLILFLFVVVLCVLLRAWALEPATWALLLGMQAASWVASGTWLPSLDLDLHICEMCLRLYFPQEPTG